MFEQKDHGLFRQEPATTLPFLCINIFFGHIDANSIQFCFEYSFRI